LLIGTPALELADLAAIGTVADVAPLAGENRAIVRLGLERLRTDPRPGLAALLARAGLAPERLDLERLAYVVAPRLNAVGRVGDAMPAARLLLASDPTEAAAIAEELEAANVLRRELLAAALDEARQAADAQDGALTIVAGEWPVGIIGLVAGRLAEERGRPAVVFSTLVEPLRGSARSSNDFDLAAAFASMADIFERFGGHAAAAGCNLPAQRLTDFSDRMAALATDLRPVEPELLLDVVVPALDADYSLLRELALLEPAGLGNPVPLVGITGLGVARVRAATGGHTQLVLRKGREVVDGICFGRDDLPALVREGDELDIVARLVSRTFGGFESLQLEVRDVAPAGSLHRLVTPAVALAS
jgi:single-stranded-DNA-specific exonuclease